jgi:hypothetical protein
MIHRNLEKFRVGYLHSPSKLLSQFAILMQTNYKIRVANPTGVLLRVLMKTVNEDCLVTA